MFMHLDIYVYFKDTEHIYGGPFSSLLFSFTLRGNGKKVGDLGGANHNGWWGGDAGSQFLVKKYYHFCFCFKAQQHLRIYLFRPV